MQRVRTLARHGPAAELSKGKQPPSFAVISETELDNLSRYLTHDPNAAAKAEQQHRLELQSVSKERAAAWPNTIEALRLRKERMRQQRLDEQEQQRCAVDADEAAFQAKVREEAIRKANLMLYEQDDRVKNFTSKLFLSHVLDERAQQVLLARQREELQRQQEFKWAILQDESIKRAKEEEDAKLALQREKAKELRQAQRVQLEQIRARKTHERDEKREEGRRVREAVERSVRKEKELEDERRARAVEINRQYVQENRRQQDIHRQRQQEEEEEFRKIQQFAKLKEEQMLERKRRAEEKFNTQLQARQEMIDRQAAHLEALRDEEEERVLTQIRDAEKERLQKEERQRERREKQWGEIHESRQKQLERADARKEHERTERRRLAARLRKMEDQLMQEELAEREDARRRAGRLQQFQLLQVRERDMKKQKEVDEDRTEGAMMLQSMAEEDDMFQSYVKSVMGDFKRRAELSRRRAEKDKSRTL